MIRAATLCSGIGAPETALPDWDWVWCSEIEPHPCRILARRFPNTTNLGDMTADDFCDRARGFGPIDVLVAGTPCQDFSIAGLRAGLRGDRGNLTLRALEIYEDACDAARSAGQPEPVYCWENVPGVLSDRGNAFGNLLAGLSGCASALVPPDGCGWTDAGLVTGPRRAVAWRVLDAQYFGLAQRRKRVFVVASARKDFDPAEILFEPEGVSGNPAPCSQTAATVAALTASGVGTCGADDNQGQAGYLIAHTLRGEGFDASEDGTGRGTPIVPVAFDCKADGNTSFSVGDLPGSLRAAHGGGHAAVVAPIASAIRGHDEGAQIEFGDDVAFTLRAAQGDGDKPHVLSCVHRSVQWAVRRLMPVECERLQGFPDGHTDLPNGNKPAADGPRYKSLGNSMAVPVVRWIGLRIQRALDRAAVIAAE